MWAKAPRVDLLVAFVGNGHQIARPELVAVSKKSNTLGFGRLARSVGRLTARHSLLERIELLVAVVLDTRTSIEAVRLHANVQVTDILIQLRFSAVIAVARLNAHLHGSQLAFDLTAYTKPADFSELQKKVKRNCGRIESEIYRCNK